MAMGRRELKPLLAGWNVNWKRYPVAYRSLTVRCRTRWGNPYASGRNYVVWRFSELTLVHLGAVL